MSRNMTSRRLTTCGVAKGGSAIRLEFEDGEGKAASVEFPFHQAESIVMTLRRVLSKALGAAGDQHPQSARDQLRLLTERSRAPFTIGARDSDG